MQSRKKVHSRLICHDSGHWQPPRNYRNPKCIRKQCARPRTIPYGRIISQVLFTIIKNDFWKNLKIKKKKDSTISHILELGPQKWNIFSLQPMASDYNSTLEVVCIPGYILPNGRRNQLLRCDSNTLWRNADNPLRNNNILRQVSPTWPYSYQHWAESALSLYITWQHPVGLGLKKGHLNSI